MTLHLYQQSEADAFRLSERSMLKNGFIIHVADEKKGLISGRKQMNNNGHFVFLDVQVNTKVHTTAVSIFASVFAGNSGTFIADPVSESVFIETFHDLLRIQPPDNPLKLSFNDYAMAAGF